MARAATDDDLRDLVHARLLTRSETNDARVALLQLNPTAPLHAFARRTLLPSAIALLATAAALVALAGPLAKGTQDAAALAVLCGGVVLLIARFALRDRSAPDIEALADQVLPPDVRASARGALDVSLAARVVTVVMWVLAAPVFVWLMDSHVVQRDLPWFVPLLFLAQAAVTTRRAKITGLWRQCALISGVLATGALAASRQRFIFDDQVTFAAAAFALGAIVIASARVRAACALFAATLWATEHVPYAMAEQVDDLFFIVVCAAATVALWRTSLPRAGALFLGGGLALLTLVEVRTIGAQVHANLGSASSLGVIACALGASMFSLRAAAVRTRAFVAAFIVAVGALFIMSPAWLALAWLAVLAGVSRARDFMPLVFLAMGAQLFGAAAGRYVNSTDVAARYGLAALLLGALAILLLRLLADAPAPVRARASASSAAA